MNTDKRRDKRWTKKCEKLLNSKVIIVLLLTGIFLPAVFLLFSYMQFHSIFNLPRHGFDMFKYNKNKKIAQYQIHQQTLLANRIRHIKYRGEKFPVCSKDFTGKCVSRLHWKPRELSTISYKCIQIELQEDFVNPLVDLFVQKMEEMCELSSKLQAAWYFMCIAMTTRKQVVCWVVVVQDCCPRYRNLFTVILVLLHFTKCIMYRVIMK